jgi:dihydroflavonol-4-reductase
VGGWTIVSLLEQGYRVRTTVRNLAREPQVRATLARQVDAGDRLSFFAADLIQDAGWERAADGADFILHVASPMGVGEFKDQDLIRPAREGTRRVLQAGAKAGVKRVVLTSSLMASLPSAPASTLGPTDESVWTDLDAPDVPHYARAKTLAERDAWEFIRQGARGMTLTTVLPALVQGPVLGADFSGSVELVARLLSGRISRLPRLGFSLVDVRDLVDLHLRALRAPEAAGERFAASSEFLWMADLARLLRERLGERAAKVPTRPVPDFLVRLAGWFDSEARQLTPNLGQRREFSSAKAERVLGWRARPMADSLVDTAESLLREGLV